MSHHTTVEGYITSLVEAWAEHVNRAKLLKEPRSVLRELEVNVSEYIETSKSDMHDECIDNAAYWFTSQKFAVRRQAGIRSGSLPPIRIVFNE